MKLYVHERTYPRIRRLYSTSDVGIRIRVEGRISSQVVEHEVRKILRFLAGKASELRNRCISVHEHVLAMSVRHGNVGVTVCCRDLAVQIDAFESLRLIISVLLHENETMKRLIPRIISKLSNKKTLK